MRSNVTISLEALHSIGRRLPLRTRGACLSLLRHLVLAVQPEAIAYRGRRILRGQLLVSRRQLCSDTGLGDKTVRNALTTLTSLGLLRCEAGPEGTLLTLVDYGRCVVREGSSLTASLMSGQRHAGEEDAERGLARGPTKGPGGSSQGPAGGSSQTPKQPEVGGEDYHQGSSEGANSSTRHRLVQNSTSLESSTRTESYGTDPSSTVPDRTSARDPHPGLRSDGPDVARVYVVRDEDDDFVPDPEYSANELYHLWRELGLPLPRSVHWCEHEKALAELHRQHPHWSRDDVEQVIRKLADDASGPGNLQWAWQKGPQYLARRARGGVQVIETVKHWAPLSSSSQSSYRPREYPRDPAAYA